jgi:hypothetical protein
MAVGDGDGHGARRAHIAASLQGVGHQIPRVVGDRTRKCRVGTEVTDERGHLALLIRFDGARPRLLGLSAHWCIDRCRDARSQHHPGRQERAQDLRWCAPAASTRRQLLRGDATGEENAVDRGDVGQHGKHPERGLQHPEERAADQTDHPLRPLHEAHVAFDADRLGARLGVAHHERSDERSHRRHRAAHVRRPREQHDDAEQHHEVGVTVDHRIEEAAERRHLPRGAGERAVAEVEQAGEQHEEPAQPHVSRDERGRREQAHPQAHDGEVVGTQAQAEQRAADGIAPHPRRLPVAAQHCGSAR